MLPAISRRVQCPRCSLRQQIRHATLIRRPKRPYTFTQLITLSDGSSFLHRTTSPAPIHRSTKDTKNSLLWNPSSSKLRNVEEDEAGRLRKFRQRFGRGFDIEALSADAATDPDGGELEEADDNESLLDLISGYGQESQHAEKSASAKEGAQKSSKSKGGK